MVVPETERQAIKANLVNLMSSVPPLVQRQLSESLSFISKSDFPERWPTLLPELVAKLAAGDMVVINGVLETASSIFERFRDAPDTDDNRRVLKAALDGFAAPLTELFRNVDKKLTEALAAGQSIATHRGTLVPLFTCLRACTVIFHELNWIDLPEYFEDNIAAWMAQFHQYLRCVACHAGRGGLPASRLGSHGDVSTLRCYLVSTTIACPPPHPCLHAAWATPV